MREKVEKKFNWRKGKINVSWVSDMLDLERPTVQSWLDGTVTRVDLAVLARWCVWLECQPGDILLLDNEPVLHPNE